jgi:tetratricopeptide (TPR) repeat protein
MLLFQRVLVLCLVSINSLAALPTIFQVYEDPYDLRGSMPGKYRNMPLGTMPYPDVFQTAFAWESRYRTVPAPESRWVENQKRLYKDLLAKQGHFDVMVVPVQVQHFGIDRIGRSYMAARLAYELSEGTDLRVPDPYSVDRALGAGLRKLDRVSVHKLAADLGIDALVWTYVGHDGNGKMELTMQFETREKYAPWPKDNQKRKHDWTEISISDAYPPLQAFEDRLAEILEWLAIDPGTRIGNTDSQPDKVPTLPQSPEGLAAASDNALQNAAQLAVLGSLTPEESEAYRDQFFERSLITLQKYSKPPDAARFLKAYSLFHLHRRPAALAVLDKSQNAESQCLRELLNGNTTKALAKYREVSSDLYRMLLYFDIYDSQAVYRSNIPDVDKSFSLYIDAESPWLPLAGRRLQDNDLWALQSNLVVKHLLDSAFPLSGQSLAELMKGRMALGANPLAAKDMDLVPVKHIEALMVSEDNAYCCEANGLDPARWDYLQLLNAVAEFNLVRKISRQMNMMGAYENAAGLLEDYDAYYGDHPAFAGLRALNAVNLSRQEETRKSAALLQVAEKYALLAAFWEQGQSIASRRGLLSMGVPSGRSRPFLLAYDRDFPMRDDWFSEIGLSGGDQVRTARDLKKLMYSHDNFKPAERLLKRGGESASAAMRQIEGRFEDDPDRMGVMAEIALNERRFEAARTLYKKAISKQPEIWDNYLLLGSLVINVDHDFAGAAEVIGRFPGFHHPEKWDRVQLSNDAYIAGSQFFWRGAIDQAREFYGISADLNTGSAASISSQLRLSLLDGDYVNYASVSLQLGRRYNDFYAYRDYLSMLHALGYSEPASDGFRLLAGKFANPQVWSSAMVGQRIAGTTEEAFRQWVLDEDIRNIEMNRNRYALAYALTWNLVDRVPMPDLKELLTEIEGEPIARGDTSRSILVPQWQVSSGNVVLLRTRFGAERRKAIKEGEPIHSGLIYFADAYVALENGRYAEAVEKFDRMQDYYDLDRERSPFRFAIPYFALASAKAGDPLDYEVYLDSLAASDSEYDVQLAKAYFSGLRGDTDEAVRRLQEAFFGRPHTDFRPLYTEYQYADTCLRLFDETGEQVFADRALDWARKHQKIQPVHAWAYALDARLSKPGSERTRALGVALYLDPESRWIKSIPAKEVVKARAWLKSDNPFTKALVAAEKQEAA